MKQPRYQIVDVARGIAFCAMFVYHAAYFAQSRGIAELGLGHDLGWRWFQKAIAGTFYLLVGASLLLANQHGVRWGPWAMRLGKLLGCALVVTVASVVLDKNSVVTYGILHNIAVCSVIGTLLLRTGSYSLLVAAAALALPLAVHTTAADTPWLHWTGLGTHGPRTFDHQPFFPWFGIVCAGIAAGGWLARTETLSRWQFDAWLPRLLAGAGRHSLLLYMAHVPLLVASVEIAALLLGR